MTKKNMDDLRTSSIKTDKGDGTVFSYMYKDGLGLEMTLEGKAIESFSSNEIDSIKTLMRKTCEGKGKEWKQKSS